MSVLLSVSKYLIGWDVRWCGIEGALSSEGPSSKLS